jgi:ribosome-associated toxin RatA of RatAB toxin-antitoxin module
MGQVTIRGHVRGLPATEVFRRIAAFPDYPRLCEAVREVEVLEADDKHMITDWEVFFHRGILRWKEHAQFYPEEGMIPFTEVDGDVDEFTGYWKVEEASGGIVTVTFFVKFDIGIPTLEDILDPIAEEALYDNVASILNGLMGEAVTVEPAEGITARESRARPIVTEWTS